MSVVLVESYNGDFKFELYLRYRGMFWETSNNKSNQGMFCKSNQA